MKGDAFSPWLMIRDDTRHSSLSDIRLDCRYCSLSFIFRGLVCTPLATVKYVHVCIKRVSIRVSVMRAGPRWNSRRKEDDLATDENVET